MTEMKPIKTYGQLLYEILQRHEVANSYYFVTDWEKLTAEEQEEFDTIADEYDDESWRLSLDKLEQNLEQKLRPKLNPNP